MTETSAETAAREPLSIDRLADDAAIQVLELDGLNVGEPAVREPHRHDYHELIWVRSGSGEHRIDGATVPVAQRSITVIGRGQVHQFERAVDVTGAVVRFAAEAIPASVGCIIAGWLPGIGPEPPRPIPVPGEDVGGLEAIVAALGTESGRPADVLSPELCGHLLATLLLWLERWDLDSREAPAACADEAEGLLHRRFFARLEQDFADHHDAGHYADALGVPGPALSRALVRSAGRPTKELITERVMLEAARLLRFTDLSIGEIAHRVGFDDQLYFSRAFRRHAGRAPQGYREMVRGRAG